MQRFSRDIEYLNSTDTTIMGSRNGQASLAMWCVPPTQPTAVDARRYALQRKNGVEGLEADSVKCFENALYLNSLFQKQGISSMLNEFVWLCGPRP